MRKLFLTVFVFLYVVACADAEIASRSYFEFVAAFGTAGHNDGQFMYPKAMAFSPDGKRLAVCDTDNNRIVILTVASSTTPASSPIIASSGANAPAQLTVELTMGDIWPFEGSTHPWDPTDAYREPDNADGIVPRRELVGRAYHGGQTRVRPGDQIPMDRFNNPEGVVWKDEQTLLVADTGNHRIKAVRLDGEVAWVLGQEGWKNGYFRYPLGIDLDKEGNLYVTEPRSKYIRELGLDFLQRQRVQGNRMQIFDKDLKPSKRLGHMHHMSGVFQKQFKDLTKVYVSPGGEVFLTDTGNHRIIVFNSDLTPKNVYHQWPYYQLRYPRGIHADAKGRLAIADTGNHKVIILSPDGSIHQILGGYGVESGKFSLPREARFASDGSLFVLDTANCRIQIFREQP